MNRRHQAISLQEAASDSPTLARLTRLAQESALRLRAVERLIPPPLRRSIQPGPIDGPEWCLIVAGSAAAAKLRQLLPSLKQELGRQGWEVTSIRLRVGSGAQPPG